MRWEAKKAAKAEFSRAREYGATSLSEVFKTPPDICMQSVIPLRMVNMLLQRHFFCAFCIQEGSGIRALISHLFHAQLFIGILNTNNHFTALNIQRWISLRVKRPFG